MSLRAVSSADSTRSQVVEPNRKVGDRYAIARSLQIALIKSACGVSDTARNTAARGIGRFMDSLWCDRF